VNQAAALSISAQYSDDEGATWSGELDVSGGDDVGFDGPFCVADGDDVWISYALGSGQVPASSFQTLDAVRVARSSGGGTSFAPAADAYDPSSGKLFLHPVVARGAGGALDVLYYAGAKDRDASGSLRSRRSRDDGASFGWPALEHDPIVLDLSRQDDAWLGDYLGVCVRGSTLHVAYVDNSSRRAHVSYRRRAAGP
jgi:hypothetical protein